MIIVAPLINPDGFFSKPQKRTNGRGVDVNRNFPTKDWKQGKKDRYYSGPDANSESETKFQIALINRFKPTHIISIHSPLGCYDYDGPSSDFDSIVIWIKRSAEKMACLSVGIRFFRARSAITRGWRGEFTPFFGVAFVRTSERG